MRRVCKSWDEVVRENWRFSTRVWFKASNNPLSIEAFSGLSKNFPVKQFKFEGVDLETNIFGDQSTFQRFSMSHCLSMSALGIQECTLSTGRFLEVLAFCKNLKHLAIRESPSIFKVDNGIGIIHWTFCYNSVRSNLANVQKLSIAGKVLRDADVLGLGSSIRGLTQLQIICEGKLPMDAVNKILKNSCETLKSVVLRGVIPYPGLGIDTGMEMKSLQRVYLENNQMDTNTMKQTESFLNKCPCLVDLHISHSKLEKATLLKVSQKLVRLRLWNCDYAANSFVDTQFPNLQKLSFFTGIEQEQFAISTQQTLKGLSECKMPKLSDVDLRLASNGADYLRSLRISNQPQLTVLSLNNCIDIAGPSLREIFKNLTALSSLSITKCVELIDDNVCPTVENDTKESLANLES